MHVCKSFEYENGSKYVIIVAQISRGTNSKKSKFKVSNFSLFWIWFSSREWVVLNSSIFTYPFFLIN